jgi:hypothetical protein
LLRPEKIGVLITLWARCEMMTSTPCKGCTPRIPRRDRGHRVPNDR